jgi:hypothetical protein
MPSATNNSPDWCLVVPSDWPGWIADIYRRLIEVTRRRGAVVFAHGEASSRLLWSERLGWQFDAVLFGQARGLVDAPRPLVDSACENPELVLALTHCDVGRHPDMIEFLCDGIPAADLMQAIERVMARRIGSIELRARHWRCGSVAREIAWECYVDECSRNRTFDLTADKLARMVVGVVTDPHCSTASVPPLEIPGLFTGTGVGPTAGAFRHAWRRALFRDQWGITVYPNVDADALWPVGQGHHLLPPDDRYWADPFVCRDGDRLWVFLEELPYATQRGHISAVCMDEAGSWSRPEVVLSESWHLSYPNVFAHEGAWYMIPESGERANVVLYRASWLPGPWEPLCELVSGLRTADPTLFFDGTQWWMTCAVSSPVGSTFDELAIFSAPRLQGPWSPSPHNPILVNPAIARPAGPWFRWRGNWVRPAQDCRGHYGRAVQLILVDGIDKEGIRERTLAALEVDAHATGVTCVHTYCRVGSDLAVDWMAWRPRWRWIGLPDATIPPSFVLSSSPTAGP